MQKDRFEQLADYCYDKFYTFEIDDMLKQNTVTDVVECLIQHLTLYDSDLTRQIVKLILYNRIRSLHSGAIKRH